MSWPKCDDCGKMLDHMTAKRLGCPVCDFPRPREEKMSQPEIKPAPHDDPAPRCCGTCEHYRPQHELCSASDDAMAPTGFCFDYRATKDDANPTRDKA